MDSIRGEKVIESSKEDNKRTVFISYNIEFAHNISDLCMLVESACKKGWECIGGVCVVFDSGSRGFKYYQATGLRG